MKNILPTVLSIFLLTPALALAQQNLVNLPIGETGDFNDYINAVYLMFISIAALIAVIKIIIAGVKYMFSDIVTQIVCKVQPCTLWVLCLFYTYEYSTYCCRSVLSCL